MNSAMLSGNNGGKSRGARKLAQKNAASPRESGVFYAHDT
jgi:hypothetical protein